MQRRNVFSGIVTNFFSSTFFFNFFFLEVFLYIFFNKYFYLFVVQFLDEIDSLWKAPFMNIKDDVGKAETLYTHSFCLSSLAGNN